MTPLEAMARAIWADSDPLEPYEACAWFWINKARAAITALRDCGVTEGMKDAYCVVPALSHHATIKAMVDEQWRAMLDTALGE